MPRPPDAKIYHITHVENLPAIIAAGELLSDERILSRGGPQTGIGMTPIKRRRLLLPVKCHPGDVVGQYVPFYFCPRSVMLYVIHCRNHPELTYRGGQEPIIHLEADLDSAIDWAEANGRRWAFSLSNAGAVYSQFSRERQDLARLNWTSIDATDWRAAEVKEAKQAEFLMREACPWHLVERIGVHSIAVERQTSAVLAAAAHQPRVQVRRDWYY